MKIKKFIKENIIQFIMALAIVGGLTLTMVSGDLKTQALNFIGQFLILGGGIWAGSSVGR